MSSETRSPKPDREAFFRRLQEKHEQEQQQQQLDAQKTGDEQLQSYDSSNNIEICGEGRDEPSKLPPTTDEELPSSSQPESVSREDDETLLKHLSLHCDIDGSLLSVNMIDGPSMEYLRSIAGPDYLFGCLKTSEDESDKVSAVTSKNLSPDFDDTDETEVKQRSLQKLSNPVKDSSADEKFEDDLNPLSKNNEIHDDTTDSQADTEDDSAILILDEIFGDESHKGAGTSKTDDEKLKELLSQMVGRINSLEKEVKDLRSQVTKLEKIDSAPRSATERKERLERATYLYHENKVDQRKKKSIFSKITSSKIFRIFYHLYNEAIRQRLFRNLDPYLLIRIIFFIFILENRSANRRSSNNSSSSKDDENQSFFKQAKLFLVEFRHHIILAIAIVLYLAQSGIVTFLYRFITADLKRLLEQDRLEREKEEEALRDQDDALSSNNEEAEQDANTPSQSEQQEPVINREPRVARLANGEIRANNGNWGLFCILEDIFYLFGTFFLSLVPSWTPIKVDVEGEENFNPEDAQVVD